MGPESSLIIVLKVTHPGSVKLEFDVTHYAVPKIFFTKASLLQGLLVRFRDRNCNGRENGPKFDVVV